MSNSTLKTSSPEHSDVLYGRFVAAVRERFGSWSRKKILAAVSGGCDSVLMLHLLVRARRKLDFDLVVGHVDHRIRSGSARDADFVAELAGELNVAFFQRVLEPPDKTMKAGRSLEEWARDERYKALEEMRVESGADVICTAHTADDNAETIVAHLARGSGVAGLAGIPFRRGRIARPLLFATRNDLLEYARKHGISWRDDATNEEDVFRRNRIRHEVMPAFREVFGDAVVDGITRTGFLMRALDEYLQPEIDEWYRSALASSRDGVFLAIPALKRYFDFQRFSVVRVALSQFLHDSPTFHSVLRVAGLVDARPGQYVNVQKNVRAYRSRNYIEIVSTPPRESRTLLVERDGCTTIDGRRIWIQVVKDIPTVMSSDPRVEFIDADSVGEQFTIRRWKAGDRMQPLGLRGSKLVSDILTDKGITGSAREYYHVLLSDQTIVWLCGVCISHRHRITEHTTKALKLMYERE
ncbi:MAG: tRNA lysidine(34) synthetase TilS [Chlorobi bacterium]|nr:tRNA lysidine(34) synthetase TilS [Chlorobiota bacterium]